MKKSLDFILEYENALAECGVEAESVDYDELCDIRLRYAKRLDQLLQTQREEIVREVVEKYGDFRAVGSKRKLGGYQMGRTLRFFLAPHTEHKDNDENDIG